MAKENTLDDLAEKLAMLNKKQDKSNEHLAKLVEIFQAQFKKEDVEDQRKKSQAKAQNKFRPSENDEGGMLLALSHGDFLKALVGVPGLILGFAGAIAGVVKFSQSLQEFFDPLNKDLQKRSEQFRAGLVAAWGVVKSITLAFGSFTLFATVTTRLASAIPIVGGALRGLYNLLIGPFLGLISKLDGMLNKVFRVSFFSVFGFLSKISKMFMTIFKIDIFIRGFLGAIDRFQNEGGNIIRKLFAAALDGVTTMTGTFIIAMVDSISMMFKGINFVFDDLLRWVEGTGFPLVSQFAGLVRNGFTWIRAFLTSNEKVNNLLSELATNWESHAKENLRQLFTELIPNIVMAIYDDIVSWFQNADIVGDTTKHITNIFKDVRDSVGDLLNVVGDAMNRFREMVDSFFNRFQFDMPDRWPWQRQREEEVPQMSRRERRRMEEMERREQDKKEAERNAANSAQVVVTDASTNTSTTAVNNQNFVPAKKATNDNSPSNRSTTVY